MKFLYSEVLRALDDANKMLLSVHSEDSLFVSSNYNFFSIYSINRITKVKTLIIEDANRDEGYRFIEGFITGLMIPRLKDLETNNDGYDNTRRSEEKALIPAKTHFSWVEKFKQWF